ncbi:hypothetical protein FRC0436_00367 [Corynebacterium diphtheriae]|nr:hypothetical protein FRC0430_00282 [Corynebacterium diphtheriae]CAB0939322.1 hypothetical protein FRC0436_00367 [Corynebacterium diphtheriae]
MGKLVLSTGEYPHAIYLGATPLKSVHFRGVQVWPAPYKEPRTATWFYSDAFSPWRFKSGAGGLLHPSGEALVSDVDVRATHDFYLKGNYRPHGTRTVRAGQMIHRVALGLKDMVEVTFVEQIPNQKNRVTLKKRQGFTAGWAATAGDITIINTQSRYHETLFPTTADVPIVTDRGQHIPHGKTIPAGTKIDPRETSADQIVLTEV